MLCKAPSSIRDDKQRYNAYLKDFFGTIKTHKIAPDHIEAFMKGLLKTGRLSHKTINNILQQIRAILNYGIKKRHLDYNPVMSIKFLPVEPKGFDYWTKEEITVFLDFTNEKYIDNRFPFIFYLIALFTGMRMGEIIGLRWDSVNFSKNLIVVQSSFDKAIGEVRNTTKGKKIRYVGMSLDLKQELLTLRDKPINWEFIFGRNKNYLLEPDNFRKWKFRQDIKQSGVKRIRIHDMRHTFASHYMMDGGNLYDLQQILGHTDIKTTMRYAHLAPSHIAHTASIVKLKWGSKDNSNIIKFQSN